MRRLLAGPIDSFEKLELLLALVEATRPLTFADLERATSIPLATVREVVGDLSRANLVAIESADAGDLEGAGKIVRLVPKADDATALNDLAKLYEEDRLLVVKALSAVAMERIRGMAARTFADAFQLRGKKGDDDG
jgi:hypothetical protein